MNIELLILYRYLDGLINSNSITYFPLEPLHILHFYLFITTVVYIFFVTTSGESNVQLAVAKRLGYKANPDILMVCPWLLFMVIEKQILIGN